MLIYYATLQENGIQHYGIFLRIKVFTLSANHSFIQQVESKRWSSLQFGT